MSNEIATNEELSLEKLSDESKNKMLAIKDEIDITDSQSIIQYGTSAQKNISEFADDILEEIKSKDAGYVGEALTNLMMNVKDLDVDSLSSGGGFFSKIPLIGGLIDKTKRFMAQYEKVSTHIDQIVDELTSAKMNLIKDIALMDKMYEKNGEYIVELDIYIIAGEEKHKELLDVIIPKFKEDAEKSGDPVDAQKVQDLGQLANRFEKKIHDLKLSRMVAIQTSPQVRLIQNNDQLLVEKIQSSILNTIPLWKNQIVIAISLFRQQKALKLQQEVSETTNDLLLKNSEMLKSNTLEVAKESEKGIVEIETLRKVNADLISTIEETLAIQHEGSIKRQAAEVELKKMEGELKAKLISSGGDE